MAESIKIADFVNYTDCRPQGICTIENESIRNYAKSLDETQMRIFLAEVSDEALVAALHIRLIERQNTIDGVRRYL